MNATQIITKPRVRSSGQAQRSRLPASSYCARAKASTSPPIFLPHTRVTGFVPELSTGNADQGNLSECDERFPPLCAGVDFSRRLCESSRIQINVFLIFALIIRVLRSRKRIDPRTCRHGAAYVSKLMFMGSDGALPRRTKMRLQLLKNAA